MNPVCVKPSIGGILIALIAPSAVAQTSVEWVPGTVFTFVSQDAWKKETGRWTLTVRSREDFGYAAVELRDGTEVPFRVSTAGVYTRPKPGSAETFDYLPVKLPISVGSTWEWSYHYLGQTTGSPGVATRKCETDKAEDVEVPAGKFNAWKINCKGSWSAGGYSGSMFNTMWYSPELSLVIKSEQRSGSDRTGYFLESSSMK